MYYLDSFGLYYLYNDWHINKAEKNIDENSVVFIFLLAIFPFITLSYHNVHNTYFEHSYNVNQEEKK
jgi:uncharacterized membrane protein